MALNLNTRETSTTIIMARNAADAEMGVIALKQEQFPGMVVTKVIPEPQTGSAPKAAQMRADVAAGRLVRWLVTFTYSFAEALAAYERSLSADASANRIAAAQVAFAASDQAAQAALDAERERSHGPVVLVCEICGREVRANEQTGPTYTRDGCDHSYQSRETHPELFADTCPTCNSSDGTHHQAQAAHRAQLAEAGITFMVSPEVCAAMDKAQRLLDAGRYQSYAQAFRSVWMTQPVRTVAVDETSRIPEASSTGIAGHWVVEASDLRIRAGQSWPEAITVRCNGVVTSFHYGSATKRDGDLISVRYITVGSETEQSLVVYND